LPTDPQPTFPPHRLAGTLWKIIEAAQEWEFRVKKPEIDKYSMWDVRKGALPKVDLEHLLDAADQAKKELLTAIDKAVESVAETDQYVRSVRGTRPGEWSSGLTLMLREFWATIQQESEGLIGQKVRGAGDPRWKEYLEKIRDEARHLRTIDQTAFASGMTESTLGTASPGQDTSESVTAPCNHQVNTSLSQVFVINVSGTGAAPESGSEVDWHDVYKKLLGRFKAGQPFTSQRDLANQLGCAVATINKAINSSSELRGWSKSVPSSSPRATSLNEVVTDCMATPRELDPVDAYMPNDEVDRVMQTLIEQARPEERAKLNALNDEGRRELAQTYKAQEADKHIEDDARKGNRILGRKP